MEVLEEATHISPDLARFLSCVAEEGFDFTGDNPSQHSAHNHAHLWMVEWWADYDRRINLAFRRRTVAWIFQQWKRRLASYQPYQENGYRLYVLEGSAPTVSVVAETPTGFPYPGEPSFVSSVDEVLRYNDGRSWRAIFGVGEGLQRLTPQTLLDTVDSNHGAIGTPVANHLGISRADVRRLIEQWGLARDVNRIRKRNHRPAAQFRAEQHIPHCYKVYEERLPPYY